MATVSIKNKKTGKEVGVTINTPSSSTAINKRLVSDPKKLRAKTLDVIQKAGEKRYGKSKKK